MKRTHRKVIALLQTEGAWLAPPGRSINSSRMYGIKLPGMRRFEFHYVQARVIDEMKSLGLLEVGTLAVTEKAMAGNHP